MASGCGCPSSQNPPRGLAKKVNSYLAAPSVPMPLRDVGWRTTQMAPGKQTFPWWWPLVIIQYCGGVGLKPNTILHNEPIVCIFHCLKALSPKIKDYLSNHISISLTIYCPILMILEFKKLIGECHTYLKYVLHQKPHLESKIIKIK